MKQIVLGLVLAACGGKATAPSGVPPATSPPPNMGPETSGAPQTGGPAAEVPVADVDDTAACATRVDRFGPFKLTAEQAAARYGQGAIKYGDAPTTKDKAIEVCGIPKSLAWLSTTKCAGGEAGKQLGRTGSVGAGGRCGAIIDLYKVECPEQVYEVHFDIYQCGPGETM